MSVVIWPITKFPLVSASRYSVNMVPRICPSYMVPPSTSTMALITILILKSLIHVNVYVNI